MEEVVVLDKMHKSKGCFVYGDLKQGYLMGKKINKEYLPYLPNVNRQRGIS